MNKTPLATIDTKPCTVGFIDGSYRIAWVGTLTDKNGEITTCINWNGRNGRKS